MRKNNALTHELSLYKKIISDFAGTAHAMLKRFNQIKADFYAGMGNGQKRWFVFCNLFLSVYTTFVIYISQSRIFIFPFRTLLVLVTSFFIILIVYNAVVFFCHKCKSIFIDITHKRTTVKYETAMLFSAICFIILLLALIASFPGGVSPDPEDQWAQAHSFAFNDWHPVIHTLFIWLATRIIDHWAFVVFVQITVFSIGVGYLIATMESWGFSRKILLITGLSIMLNPYNIGNMMHPWKDSAFTILIMYTTIMVINTYFSGGMWFSKSINVILFALTTGLASIVRHNGFFFTVPLYVIVVFLYSRKTIKTIMSVVLAVSLIFLVKVPLYNALGVTRPNNTYEESVGIPMNILGHTLIENPKLLPLETKEFLYRIASDDEWRETYMPGEFNYIKWHFNAPSIIVTVPPKTLLKWVLQTCINAKYEAFHAICDATAIVWRIGNLDFIRLPSPEKENAITRALFFCFFGYTGLCFSLPVISLLFANLGLLMLLLLIIGIFSLGRNGIKALLLVVPSIAYNLGTMLLLFGPSQRFFHFNFVITIPLLFVLLSKQGVQEK